MKSHDPDVYILKSTRGCPFMENNRIWCQRRVM